MIYYNLASKLKFYYTDIKNTYSNDNKYLAMVTDSGLWLKDELNENILIVKANNIKNEFRKCDYKINLIQNLKLINTIQSEKVNIENNLWLIEKSNDFKR